IEEPVAVVVVGYNWATKLFALGLTISSMFIYNINGVIGRNDIKDFS
ncbi:8237_t:CDS:2, partial [Ambispora leptoticha]